VAGVRQLGEEREEGGLVRADLHAGVAAQVPVRLLDEVAHHRVGFGTVGDDVRVEVVADRDLPAVHG
jgi:hypothetical protein